jgi:hypothetical protein
MCGCASIDLSLGLKAARWSGPKARSGAPGWASAVWSAAAEARYALPGSPAKMVGSPEAGPDLAACPGRGFPAEMPVEGGWKSFTSRTGRPAGTSHPGRWLGFP